MPQTALISDRQDAIVGSDNVDAKGTRSFFIFRDRVTIAPRDIS
ncbi:hypothetical protein [Leptolyngbya sp. FACHB-321]|nr:hypothetical protein [Leptolyngbya sp. FACHB-321]